MADNPFPSSSQSVSRLWICGVITGLSLHRARHRRIKSIGAGIPKHTLEGLRRDAEEWIDKQSERIHNAVDRVVKRDREPLLPTQEALKYPYKVPTLVFDLDKIFGDVRYHPMRGWSFNPFYGASGALRTLSKHYELVLWTRQPYPYGFSFSFVSTLPLAGVLHRNDAQLIRSRWHRPLWKLGRDMKTIIVLEGPDEATPGSGEKSTPTNVDVNSLDENVIRLPSDGTGLTGLTRLLLDTAKTHESLQAGGGRTLDFPSAIQSRLSETNGDLTQIADAAGSSGTVGAIVETLTSWFGLGSTPQVKRANLVASQELKTKIQRR